MAGKNSKNEKNKALDRLKADIDSRCAANCYIFHGHEHYLRDRYLDRLRKLICPDGLDSFNYKRFEGKDLNYQIFTEAVEMLPFNAERTLIEIHDFDILLKRKSGEESVVESENDDDNETDDNGTSVLAPYLTALSSLPDYVCIVFVYDTINYNPNIKLKHNKEILAIAQSVEFGTQNKSSLEKWVIGHYKKCNRKISLSDVRYLIQITGADMAWLNNEIEKTSAYTKSDIVTREDIDAVVIPNSDAVVYKLTDAILKHNYRESMRITDELLRMREPSHMLTAGISKKMRQLLAARVSINNGINKSEFMKLCGINWDFQADELLRTAKKMSLSDCQRAVLICSQAARELNSMSQPEERIIELVIKLANL